MRVSSAESVDVAIVATTSKSHLGLAVSHTHTRPWSPLEPLDPMLPLSNLGTQGDTGRDHRVLTATLMHEQRMTESCLWSMIHSGYNPNNPMKMEVEVRLGEVAFAN